MTKKSSLRVLVLTFTPFKREPRALKQVFRLRADYDVTTAGFGEAPVSDVRHIELDSSTQKSGLLRLPGMYPLALLLRRFRFISRALPVPSAAYKQLSAEHWDIIIAHDVATISTANRLQPSLGVLSDLHEYAPRQNEHSLLWRLLIAPYFRWLIRNEVSRAKEVTTVSRGIVEEYERQFGIKSHLVINATPYREAEPTRVGQPIRLVHSGIPGRARRLDIMIEGVKKSHADVTLDLFLMPTDPEHLTELRALADGDPRIRFRDPVPYSELLETLSQFDVGISLIAPTTFNLEWCLPNKFFDFVQARLGVIIGPSPEMARFVDQHGIGAISDDFTSKSFSQLLDTLTHEQVAAWKVASHEVAREMSAEKQVELWAQAVDRIATSN